MAGCSFALDSGWEQCSTDEDCATFETDRHVACQSNVCVRSEFGPAGCSTREPTTDSEFANRCTTAMTMQFDNCERLGLCSDVMLAGAMATKVMPTATGSITTPENHQTAPTVTCAQALTDSTIIYVTGSTNLPPLIQAVQAAFDKAPPPHYTVVFAPQTSCKGAAAIYDPDPAKHLIKDQVDNYAFYYRPGDTKPTLCLLAPGGNVVDVGESDVYPQSCGYGAVAGIADYSGPIQAIAFVVPTGSSQRVISAEAAHLVFGAGGNANRTAPWTDPALYFVRSSGTGTVQLPSRAIQVDPVAWWGIDRLSATNLVDSMKVIDPTKIESAIGILSSDFADRNRGSLRVLAFQQRGQRHAYFPDSTPESADKANVRDGHYPIWGAIHLLAPTTNDVASPTARALINQLHGDQLDKSVVDAIIDGGYIPQCAMKVKHSEEVGPLMVEDSDFGCSCYFDDRVTHGKTTCPRCELSTDCPAGNACRYGFCEKPPGSSGS
jgi:hypothetical protein